MTGGEEGVSEGRGGEERVTGGEEGVREGRGWRGGVTVERRE